MTDPSECLAQLLGPQRLARLHERAVTMELDDTGLLRLVVEMWLAGQGPTAQALQPTQPPLFANTTLPAPPPPKKIRRSALAGLIPASNLAEKEELDWRVDQVWEAHLRAWSRFWTSETGIVPRAPSQPNTEMRAGIVRALRSHDAHLLGPEARDAWILESETRAAGIGIFYDPWMTGHHKDNDAAGSGRRYLSHDRPWVIQRGKEDPVSRYATLYFEQKAIFDEQDRRGARREDAPAVSAG